VVAAIPQCCGAKTLQTEEGPIEIEVPRDRNGTFEPRDGVEGEAALAWLEGTGPDPWNG
jgi:hypothetical protein